MKELFTFLLLSTMFLCFALETYKVGGGYEETSILPGETLTIEADVPPPPPNEKNTLFFVARLKGELSVRDFHVMRITANGRILNETINDIPRIVNRTSKTFHGTQHPYTAQDNWNVAANQDEDYIEIIHVPEDYSAVYCYELDISDLKPGKHKFTWTNLDKVRPLLIKMPQIQSRRITKCPYAPLRSFIPTATMPANTVIDADNGKAKWKFDLPEIRGSRQVLRLRARLNIGSGWGYNGNLNVILNEKKIGHTMKNANKRLFNRTNDTFMGDAIHPAINWKGDFCIFHHYNDNISERLKKFPTVDGLQHFWFYLDISDIVDSNNENTLTFINNADSKAFGQSTGNPKLIIECCEVGYVIEEAMEMLPTEARRTTATGPTVKKNSYELTVQNKTFGIQLRRGKDLFYIDTFLSYPNGGKNMLSTAGAPILKKKEPEWKPQVKIDGDTITVTAQGKYYSLVRKLICKENVVHVRDTIKSLSNDILGIIYNNYLVTGTIPKAIYKHGALEPITPWKGNHDYPATNSTMFVQLAQGGLGLFVEDNIFKLQCEYSVKGNLLNYTTEHLGFAPHSEYTLEWNLYPLQEGDYFDFINQVRDYLGVNNHTIPGAISWPINIKDNAVKKQYMANLGFKIPAIYWFDYDSFDPQDATTEQRLAPCFREYQKHKAFDPAMKPVFMWQNNYTRCNYKDMKEPFFPDSCVIEPDGTRAIKSLGWRSGQNGYFTERYFHVDNTYYKYAMEVLPKMLEKDITGIYFDTPNHIQKAYSRFTYDRWDNHTVDIDPVKYTVTRKYADLCLISGPARINIAKLITASGKYMYYNNPPLLKEMMKVPNCVYMIEGDTVLQLGTLHLTVPLAFGEHSEYNSPYKPLYGRRKTWLGAEDFMDDICWKIRNGVLYNAYRPPFGQKGEKVSSAVLDHEYPLAYMYPITVTDIHAGWIRGKERIITIDSGTFGWKNTEKTNIELRLFDKTGRNIYTENLSSGNGMFKINVPKKGMAILIRK